LAGGIVDVAREREMKCRVCRVHEGLVRDANVLSRVREKHDLLRDFTHDRDSLPRWIDSERRTGCVAVNTA
jgi:hypothetical protein